ncbi:MAG: rRNA maturation RNase YbeY [Treponema sp.]|nr:rRNA maturation RNase YbeY [Treponema sp.]
MNIVTVSLAEDTEEPLWFNKIESFMQDVMQKLNYSDQEVSVLFCTNSFIAKLNSEYRNVEGATDVLSFENGESYIDKNGKTWKCMGDIVISIEMIAQNALSFNTDSDTELKRLLIHGLLHLNGYDHGDEHLEQNINPSCEMLVLQEKLVQDFSKEKIIEN